MESGFGREYRPEYDSVMQYYNRVISTVIDEMGRNPEAFEEMRRLQTYIRLMQSLLPTRYTPTEQDEIVFTANRRIESIALPSVPVKLPPPGSRINVGEHMTVTPAEAAECWPGKSAKTIQLDDLTRIWPKSPIGRIDIVRNLPELDTSGSVIQFTRNLMSSTVKSLRELALLCQNRDEQVVPMHAMAGISHLARMGERFGFTVFGIETSYDQARATQISQQVAQHVAGNNHAWQKLSGNYKPAQIAYISQDRLVELYGTQGPINLLQRNGI